MAARRVLDRQLWIDGHAQFCQHSPEAVLSEGGTLLAEVCRHCQARLAEYGDCDGTCKKRATRLTAFVVTSNPPRRFCTVDCRQHTLQSEKEAREARRKRARP